MSDREQKVWGSVLSKYFRREPDLNIGKVCAEYPWGFGLELRNELEEFSVMKFTLIFAFCCHEKSDQSYLLM